MSDKNITEFGIGIDLDTSPANQKKGTYRFSLNTVNESEIGDKHIRSNEEANEECSALTPGFVPIGKCYIGNNQTIIFSVSEDNKVSEIGIQDDNCNYVVHVNDSNSPENDKLGFKLENQIEATYRLRRGCERTVYFVGKNYPVRYFNFDKPLQFKTNGKWSSIKFSLFRKLNVFPTIDEIVVSDTGGNLTPGSYTIMVQHLDEDLNGTEFHELVKDINIYNDSLNKNFVDIQGSSHINIGDGDDKPFLYDNTTKSISISLDAVDTDFTYIRFAFIERTSGNGSITSVKYSDIISVTNPIFIYTGDNANTNGTIEEVELYNLNSEISTAQYIEQIDNMLILSNVLGEQANICKLQQYASKIKTDCFVKDIILTSIQEKHNPKNPLVVNNGLTYQPGEIYSLGIMYLFDDYSTSPVMHIPGKSPNVNNLTVFSPGDNVFPMSNINNINTSEIYLDESSSCSTENYWGLDSEGDILKNKKVRHHRFPTRDEIGIGFVKRKETNGTIVNYKQLVLYVTGVPNIEYNPFKIILRFKKNGIIEEVSDIVYPVNNVSPSTIKSNIYEDSVVISNIQVFTKFLDSNTEEEVILTNNESGIQDNNLEYKLQLTTLTENNISNIYQVPIMGLKFSNIELPSEEEIGKKVIGYQIVRQERTETDKTILDSAVIFPMTKSGKNVTTAMLAPEYWLDQNKTPSTCEGSEDNTFPTCYNISKRNVMLLTPTHKFTDKTHDSFTSIKQVGNFKSEYVGRTGLTLQNVYEGTSASGNEDNATDDSDGFSLQHGVRFTGVKYESVQGNPWNINNQNTRLYNLEACTYSETEDNNEILNNLSFDNKALILSSNQENTDLRTYRPGNHSFPYVYIKKDNNSFYQGFRNNPYYQINGNVYDTDTCIVFGGDTYICPMRHTNHIFGNGVSAMRRKKVSFWAIASSVLAIIIGVIISIVSFGAATPAVLAGIGGILIAVGATLTAIATRLDSIKFQELYGEKWKANIDRTVFDFPYARMFIREHPQHELSGSDADIDPHYLSWEDDTFKWWGEIVGDLWFETPLNISLRVVPITNNNNYLKPLTRYMPDLDGKYNTMTLVDYVSNQITGTGRFHRYKDPSELDGWGVTIPEEEYFVNKITTKTPEKNNGNKYHGYSLPVIYMVNPDHYVTTGIKKFYTIPLEYDCCSECRECFPHRIHYSQQSFQEEKSDNYRMFLPNNYRDIEGETGEITNMFRWYNNLYIHTEEALWQMGRNYQERVTDNVVSFIGTGSYFEIPPQKILDDETGSSAGTRHNWGMIKTPEGIFFPSENQKRIYQFTGKDLKPISELGISNWMKNNIQINVDKQFLKLKGYEYPNRNNPSSFLGSGFISTYDSRKERIIFTKKDIKLKDELFTGDTDFCINGNTITLFHDITNTIMNYNSQGWSYNGIDNCKLKFYKDVVKTRTEIRDVTVKVSNDADIIVHLDMSGSFNNNSRNQIKSAVNQWLVNFSTINPDWTGNLYYSTQEAYESQRCWKILRFIKTPNAIRNSNGTFVNINNISKNIVAVSFVNENLIGGYNPHSCYHPELTSSIGNGASDFYEDYTDFVNLYQEHISNGGTFNALNYPINYNNQISNMTKGFVQHVLAAIKGISYTQAEVDALIPNPFMSSGDWNLLKTSLMGNNPYPDNGFENFGWKAITNRGWAGSGDVITAAQFQDDMTEFLQGINTTVQQEVEVNYVEREYLYVDGEQKPVEDVIDYNASWTMSYSLEDKTWTSWHSYLPSFYINVPEKFYSWKHGSNSFWKHGKTGEYCKFYGVQYPWIIEYVSASNSTTTKIHDSITVVLDAKKYQSEINEFYDVNDVFFNKMIAYNSRQCSGLMNLVLKKQESNYLYQQVNNLNNNEALVDRTERNWNINDFRDLRVDYNTPIFKSDLKSIQENYYIDKVLNEDSINYNKTWSQLENFRDKYLVVRLIFDKFVDTKMLLNFSLENETVSNR